VVTQGTGKKAQETQPGSFEMKVVSASIDKRLDSTLFAIPPAGYKKSDRNQYFKDGAVSSAGSAMQQAATKPRQ
jgi:hypothetical protein